MIFSIENFETFHDAPHENILQKISLLSVSFTGSITRAKTLDDFNEDSISDFQRTYGLS